MQAGRDRRRTLARRVAVEFGPLLAFFIANAIWDIYAATLVLMGAAILSCGYALLHEGRLPVLPLVSAGLAVVLGGLTLALGQPWLIKLRPTILNGGIALALAVALAIGRLPLRRAFGRELRLPDDAWRTLTRRAIVYLAALAALNEVVRLNFSTDTWVAFKTFGVVSLNLLFAASQIPLARRSRAAAARDR
ncbi:inner membrane-spanning protein YciB [Falsiroseomonas sp.]|uniref:inner membrane-spanning protein YciB n=1 Tax=Falsiroseomonas sp. TaxID=2870721 RepID=UPI00356B5016